MGRTWKPKVWVICRLCGWTGKRSTGNAVDLPCPRCRAERSIMVGREGR